MKVFMLNLKFDFGVSVSESKYPVTFHKRNTCIHCGADGSLEFVDIFGNKSNKEIHPFDHIKCKKCGRSYSINWEQEEDSCKMYPVAVEPGIKQEFFNLVKYPFIKNDCNKEF